VSYKLNGKMVDRDEFLAGAHGDGLKTPPRTAKTYTEHDPLISDGCGVMKAQIPEMREAIMAHGIQGAAVLDNGQIRFTSRRARKQLLAMRGLVDSDGSYGD
jgi:hypothetical protein